MRERMCECERGETVNKMISCDVDEKWNEGKEREMSLNYFIAFPVLIFSPIVFNKLWLATYLPT